MYRRFLLDNPNEKINPMTFYRAIQRYHRETGVDALLVQSADHNVDAMEKVLNSLMNLEHKKKETAHVSDNSELEEYHLARYNKLKGLLEQHQKNKRVNREFDEDFLTFSVALRTTSFRQGHVNNENEFRQARTLLISYKHTDDMSDMDIPTNMLSVMYHFFTAN